MAGDRKKTNSGSKRTAGLRKRAEEELRRRVGEVEPEKLSVEEARSLVHELQVHQIELEMQNEELRLQQTMLEEARQKYSELYDFAPVGYFTLDREGRILEANLTGADLLGEARSRLTRKPFTVYIAKGYQNKFNIHSKKVFDAEEPQACELGLKKKDGSEFHAEIKSVTTGENTMHTAVSDITERKKAEMALAESEDKHRAIFEQARDGILLTDFDTGEIVDCNAEFERQTGRKLEELREMKIWEVRPREQVEAAKRKFDETRKRGEGASSDLAYLRPDGGVTPIEFIAKVVAIRGKRYLQGITRDITERKKAEEQLRIQEKAVASSLDAIVMADQDGNLIYVNESFLRIMGYENQDEVLGKPAVTFARYEHEGMRVIEALRGEGRWQGEIEGRRKDGSPIFAHVSANMVLDEKGEPLCMMASFEDITERKKAEEELANYRRNLEHMVEERAGEIIRVNRQLREEITRREQMEDEITRAQKLESVGILAGGIAHDFNNALTSIMNNIYAAKMFVENGEESDKALGTLEAASKAIRRATGMAHQLLTFAEGGEPVRKTAYIKNLIKDTVDFALRGANVKCVLHLADDLWPAYVDEGQISQVVSNLVINADQSMPEGGKMEVAAENVKVKKSDALPLKEGRYLMLTVRDQGSGIPKKYLPKVFDPYFTTKQKGSGLGLATSYSIVRKHGGLITVDSKAGSGTSFIVYLPASKKKAAKDAEAKEEDFRGGKILVMDDEEEVRDSLKVMLKLYGYDADFARDGAEAIEAYKKAMKSDSPYDAVVMDLTVPGGIGGVEATKRIKKIDPGARAVVASGYSNDPVMADYEEYGFLAALPKPYDVAELSKILQKIMEGNSG